MSSASSSAAAPQIVITEFMDAAAVQKLNAAYPTLYDPILVDAPDALPGLLGEARALIVRNRTQVRTDLLAAAPRLTCVGRLGVGLDNIDTEACAARGVAVYPATGANDAAVAEYVVAAALMVLRGAYHASTAVAAGEWPRQALIGREIGGKTLGLVGFGAIARETAVRARALGMIVTAYDPYIPATDPAWASVRRVEALEALLAAADVVSLHVPLTTTTRAMIGAEALSRMKPDAVLINAARGGIVDEEALAAALKAGRLSGAALDVFDAEPLSAAAGARFAEGNAGGSGNAGANVLLTPHIAGVTVESNVRVSALIAETVLAHLGD